MSKAMDAVAGSDAERVRKAEEGSESLKVHILHAINREAVAWGISFSQAKALLLDRKKVEA